ncbi:MAG TPA: 4a-hydroxytetrahydrobiopterin dehydratase, partial [Candidatus Kapabacteria bacterium]|nr:4a-hydroxytetrahydrobiopterin dehydratase [Candidatus Kapabacteria bacterium]
MDLQNKHCSPLPPGTPPLSEEQIAQYEQEITDIWEIIDNKMLSRAFSFPDFAQALRFVNAVGDLAEKEQHHPDIHIHYNKVLL